MFLVMKTMLNLLSQVCNLSPAAMVYRVPAIQTLPPFELSITENKLLVIVYFRAGIHFNIVLETIGPVEGFGIETKRCVLRGFMFS